MIYLGSPTSQPSDGIARQTDNMQTIWEAALTEQGLGPVVPRPETSSSSDLGKVIHNYGELSVEHGVARGEAIRLEAELHNNMGDNEGLNTEGQKVE